MEDVFLKSKGDKSAFRVLSLDGGGSRGLYTACVLDCLSKRYSNGEELDIGKGFDLIVGTSTGGIIATALASGVPISKVVELYKTIGPSIFKNPQPDRGLRWVCWLIKNISSSANKSDLLKDKLIEFFKEETVVELWEKRNIGLCLTAVDMSTYTARVFKTPHFANKNLDNGRKLVDIALATSAAPIYFPMAKLPHPDGHKTDTFIDGGLWANNPILVGFIEALQLCGDRDVEIVSVGTRPAVVGNSIPEADKDVGLLYWGVGTKPLLVSMDAQAFGHLKMAEFLSAQLSDLGKSCKVQRLHQEPPSESQAQHLKLDRMGPDSIKTLVEMATRDAELINGKIGNNTDNYKILDDAFKSMPKLILKE